MTSRFWLALWLSLGVLDTSPALPPSQPPGTTSEPPPGYEQPSGSWSSTRALSELVRRLTERNEQVRALLERLSTLERASDEALQQAQLSEKKAAELQSRVEDLQMDLQGISSLLAASTRRAADYAESVEAAKLLDREALAAARRDQFTWGVVGLLIGLSLTAVAAFFSGLP